MTDYDLPPSNVMPDGPHTSTALPGGVPAGARLDWRAVCLIVALATAETAALWLVASLMAGGQAARHGIPAWALFVLVAGAALTPRLLEAFDVWNPRFEMVMALAIAATTLIAVKAAAFPQFGWFDPNGLRALARALILRPSGERVWVWSVILISAYAWWRGRRRSLPSLDAAYATLRGGMIVVLAFVVLNLVVWGPAADRPVSGAVLVFFAAALASVALAHVWLDIARERVALGPRWLATLVVPIGLVLGAAVIATGIFSQDLLSTLLWVLAPLIWGLLVVFRVFILIVAVIAFLIVSPVLWLLAGHQLRVVRIPASPRLVDRLTGLQHVAERAGNVPNAIRYLIALAVLSALFSAVARFMFRRRHRPGRGSDEERESVLDLGGALGGLPARLRRLLHRHVRAASDPLAALRRDPRWAATVAIRDTYRQFLRWSRDCDLPRSRGATPREHAARLTPHLATPSARDDVALLTASYNCARYDAAPATEADAAEGLAAWRRLERALPSGDGR